MVLIRVVGVLLVARAEINWCDNGWATTNLGLQLNSGRHITSSSSSWVARGQAN